MRDVITAVLGGGQGSRLSPLTRYRAKPAVPIGGKFRLIDIPISNSLHAGIDRVYVLTQFNSESLHRHIAQTYRFDHFSHGFVNILAAEQTVSNTSWYQGTADAVRQNIERLLESGAQEVVILSGDQLYLMDIARFVATHRERRADLTIAVKPMPRSTAKGLGIMRVDAAGRIIEFVEKPQRDDVLDRLAPEGDSFAALGLAPEPDTLLASMGIYVFRLEVLAELLAQSSATDFGHEVIPSAIGNRRVFAFGHEGYWQDIGTIPSFLDANIDLARPLPPLNLYDPQRPIYTHPRFVPATKINRCTVQHAILAEGSIISDARIERSIIGLRAIVQSGAVIEDSYVMGATEYEPLGARESTVPRVGVGRDCEIRRAILDFNARIGDGARLVNERGVDEEDGDNYVIRGGIIVVPKNAVIAPGTVI